MGTWGTGISSNDTYADTYEKFIDHYNKGLSVANITKQLIKENHETINTPEEATNFWFAIANAQWECKELDKEVLARVKQIILTKEDLIIWEKLNASVADLKLREKVLEKFLKKISIEKDKPKTRITKKLYSSIFKTGDCLTYVMNNGNYGGAFVLTEEQNTPVGRNYIAITTIDKAQKPTMLDFKSADIYIRNEQKISVNNNKLIKNRLDVPVIGGFFASAFKNGQIEIEVVGQLPIYKDYEIEPNKLVGTGWMALKVFIPSHEEYVKINGKAEKTLKLCEWTEGIENGNQNIVNNNWLKRGFSFLRQLLGL